MKPHPRQCHHKPCRAVAALALFSCASCAMVPKARVASDDQVQKLTQSVAALSSKIVNSQTTNNPWPMLIMGLFGFTVLALIVRREAHRTSYLVQKPKYEAKCKGL